ncbi:glycosyltransferase [Spongiimicrobium sp. 2-473A-2-J]|uniref:glycosyltransferase n=1 Tax=Eudoraea algarum TaxID=3417568 RepID=UPI003D35E2EF
MKILHIINSLEFGGAEKLLVDTLPVYVSKGLNADVLVLKEKETPFMLQLSKVQGVNILSIKKINGLYNPLYIIKLLKYIQNYDIVHVHLFPAIYWASLSSFLFRKRTCLVLTEHNTENRRRKLLIFKYLDRFIYRRYSKIIAISEAVRINLENHLGSKFKNIVQINNGIDLNIFKKAIPYEKKDLGLEKDTKTIIQVSSFTAQKDQTTLIRAMVQLPKRVHLQLVGDGPLREDAIKLVLSLGLEDRVHFLGHRTDVPRLLKTSDISVLSSHYEGFGLAMVEGMAAGNACLGSNVPGLSEIIGEDGILFPPGDEIVLRQKLFRLIHDKDYFRNTVKKCKQKAESYDCKLMVQRHIDLYRSLYDRHDISLK